VFDTFETIRKALGIESTFAFVAAMAIVGAIMFGFAAWVVDRNARHSAEISVDGALHMNRPNLVPPASDREQIVAGQRQLTGRTPSELLGLYKNVSPLQGDDLMQPFKGLWVTVKGKVRTNPVDAGNGTSQFHIFASDGATCVCTFSPHWRNAVKRIRIGDEVTTQGQISEGQNGSVLYLLNCDLLEPGSKV